MVTSQISVLQVFKVRQDEIVCLLQVLALLQLQKPFYFQLQQMRKSNVLLSYKPLLSRIVENNDINNVMKHISQSKTPLYHGHVY